MTIKQLISSKGGTAAFVRAVNGALSKKHITIRLSGRTAEKWAQGVSEPSLWWAIIFQECFDADVCNEQLRMIGKMKQ
jgi:hypothetical protein